MSGPLVRVGVGVFVFSQSHPSKFLMGVRLSSLGSGTLALPGGHLEFGESFEECAIREVKEETDLEIVDVRFLTAVSSVFESEIERKHYVTIFMVGEVAGGQEPRLMEPEKCEGWGWNGWEEMKGSALAELREMEVGMKGEAETGRNAEENTLNGRCGSLSKPATVTHKHKLFLPLLNLVRDRPNVIPRLERTDYSK